MGANTRIEWATDSYNPWLGCVEVSPGCAHCYARELARRFHGSRLWGRTADREVTRYRAAVLRWAAEARAHGRPRRVFCGSMCDVFEDHPQVVDLRRDLWELIAETPELIWMLLTKRPENIGAMVPWVSGGVIQPWPRNVWLGVSIENQKYAEIRIPELLKWPASVRFLSCEPLLGPIDLKVHLWDPTGRFRGPRTARQIELRPRGAIQWVIVGGESGKDCRPMELAWARNLRIQCRAAGVAFFFKQLGGHPDKGTDPTRQPADLRIRELPKGPRG